MNLIDVAGDTGCRIAIACDDIGINIKTYKRWKINISDKRKGPNTAPANKLSSEERIEVIKISTSEDYMNLPPSQIVPMLADKGRYIASESTFYRILKEMKLLEHRGKSRKTSHKKPAPLVATAPNQIYSWDITYLRGSIRGSFYYLYMFMDIFSRKIVGYDVHEVESMELSSKLIDRICKEEGISKNQLTLHADNGGAMKGATMLATLQRLGVIPSFSRPKVSDDNPYSEALFKTVKYCPMFPSKPFQSLDEARLWVDDFVDWYNNKHLHSGIKFVTPANKHAGRDIEILRRRKVVYETAKLSSPNRWSGNTRNWNEVDEVFLNYIEKDKELKMRFAS
jgi:transposase InsO family protein